MAYDVEGMLTEADAEIGRLTEQRDNLQDECNRHLALNAELVEVWRDANAEIERLQRRITDTDHAVQFELAEKRDLKAQAEALAAAVDGLLSLTGGHDQPAINAAKTALDNYRGEPIGLRINVPRMTIEEVYSTKDAEIERLRTVIQDAIDYGWDRGKAVKALANYRGTDDYDGEKLKEISRRRRKSDIANYRGE